MARKLKEILISEVSLVNEPANKRKFAVIKHQKGQNMDELRKLIEAFTGQKLDDTTIAKAKPNEAIVSCLIDQLKLIDKYRNDLPVDVVAAIGGLATHAAFTFGKADDNAEASEETDKTESTEKSAKESEDAKGDVDTIDIDQFTEQIVTKASSAVGDALKEMKNKVDAISAQFEELQKSLKVDKPAEGEHQLSDEEITKMVTEYVAKRVRT
jgi:hypothetical protein